MSAINSIWYEFVDGFNVELKYDGISAMPMFYIRVDARKSAWNRKLNTMKNEYVWNTLLVCKSFNAIRFIWSKMEFFVSIKKSVRFSLHPNGIILRFSIWFCVSVCALFPFIFQPKIPFCRRNSNSQLKLIATIGWCCKSLIVFSTISSNIFAATLQQTPENAWKYVKFTSIRRKSEILFQNSVSNLNGSRLISQHFQSIPLQNHIKSNCS